MLVKALDEEEEEANNEALLYKINKEKHILLCLYLELYSYCHVFNTNINCGYSCLHARRII
jgi:hypothetical protein